MDEMKNNFPLMTDEHDAKESKEKDKIEVCIRNNELNQSTLED